MRRLLLASSAVTLIATGAVFQACGGSDSTGKDGGPDGMTMMVPDVMNPQPDGNMMMPDTGMDMDSGADVVVDAGPKCTNMPCVVGLAVGGHHACALINDGTVRCWGASARGQLGNAEAGVMTPRSVPVPVDGIMTATQVAATTVYTQAGGTCVRLNNGSLQCFGDDNNGILGLGADAAVVDNNPHLTPGAVQGLPMAANVQMGNFHVCSATSANDYWCWGLNQGQQINALGRGLMTFQAGPPGKATSLGDAGSIASGWPGTDFNVVLTTGGTVYTWGGNGSGQLGRQTQQGNDDPNPAPLSLTNVTQVASGLAHACAVNQKGDVYCWGDNQWGQLGRGIQGGTSDQPQVVTIGKTMTQVAASNFHTCALANDGTVYCWGRNNAGQVGPNTPDGGGFNPQPATSPVQVMGLTGKALAIGTGGTNLQNGFNGGTGYTCALIEGGSVECWGYNGESELGRGPNPMNVMMCQQVGACSPTPAPVVWQ